MIEGRSAWEVISASPDFLATAAPPPAAAINGTAGLNGSSKVEDSSQPVRRPRIDLVWEPEVKVKKVHFIFI
jgi:hypothetical protein